jgi:dienelactone hydrolase
LVASLEVVMRIRAPWVAILVCGVVVHTRPAIAQVDQQRAQAYFKEAQALCERDGGRLWGVSVCAPMVIGDARTQTFATSQPPPDAPRPRGVGFVNAPIQWGGVTWIAYTWDDLANAHSWRRNEILLHEMFHGVQAQLGLTVGILENEHLDALDGRYWLQLEWRALARALGTSGEERNAAVRDALAFRQERRRIYPAAAENERGLEINEGVASYAGTVLAAASRADANANALTILTGVEGGESFVRTFAYNSGPAYGLLLDAASPGWHRTLRSSDDLGLLLTNALAVQPAPDAAGAAARYGGVELRAAEEQRERLRQDRINELRRRFVDGPVLVVPGGGSGMSDSRGATVIPGTGTVYFHAYRASGPWGTLEAENGVLLASDGRSRRVPAPVRRDDGSFSGDGWTVKVATGWTIREGARRGDYEVVRQSAPGPAGAAQPPREPSVTREVVFGHKDGLALTYDVHRPAHGSSPRYPMSAIVADVRRAVRFIRRHAGEYGVDPNRIGVYGGSAGGHLALLLGTTADSGDPSASDAVLRESSRVAAVAANFPPTDLVRFVNRRSVPATAALTEAEAAQYSPIRFVSSDDAPSLIVHGDADEAGPIIEGETMHEALTTAGVPASFMRIEGAGHAFGGADLERIMPQ